MRTRRSWFLLGAILVAVVVVGVLVIPGMLTAEEPDSAFDDTVPRTTQTPPPPDAPTPDAGSISEEDGETAEAAAEELLDELLPQVAEISDDRSENIVGDLSDVASQAYLSELESERLEFEAEGWTREGDYVVEDIETLEYTDDADGATAVVKACVDASELVVRRSDGTIVEPDSASLRAWHVYVLEQGPDGSWEIVGRSFANDPGC